MTAKASLARLANRVLGSLGGELVSRSEIRWLRAAWQRQPREVAEPLPTPPLPEGAETYLRADNPRLVELRERYRAFGRPAAARSVWTPERVAAGVDLCRFRADGAFVWQSGGDLREVNYALTTAHVRAVDRLGLLDRLDEDGLFGAVTFDIDGLRVSRDRLDSVLELNFLHESLELPKGDTTVLDVGAGYGRLAWAIARAFPGATTLCTDVVPEATFLSEYYLRQRGAGEAARVIPLDEIEGVLARTPVRLATNVHSFSEAPLESIRWWIGLLARHAVPFLLIVPNSGDLRSSEADGSSLPWSSVVEDCGYAALVRRDKYVTPSVQRNGLSPTSYHLFERRS